MMSGNVTLTVTAGPMQEKDFIFEEHDTFVCGRLEDCQLRLQNDQQISRHHFLLEINPPDIRIRDLGSRNGTYVNGQKYGGRLKHETPEEGARREYPQLDLHDGDVIGVGQTSLRVGVQAVNQVAAQVCCLRCGKNVSQEVGPGREGDYICHECRPHVEANLAELLFALLRQADKAQSSALALQIPHYQIERKLGVGGMGAVYQVRHRQTGQIAALKIMLAKIAVDEASRLQFLREMVSMQALHHPHVVAFLDSGAQGSMFYFLVEYCEGGNLDQWMRQLGRPLQLKEAAPVMLQILEGLAYIHKQSFVHRDLKPQNILLAGPLEALVAKVADLGLAKNFIQAGYSGMTATGGFAGSYPFMPREQVIHFKYCKPVSDVWSIGATFYYLLAGTYPRQQRRGQDPLEVILQGSVVPLAQHAPALPKGFLEVIDRALLNDVTQRYQDAGEMLQELTRVL